MIQIHADLLICRSEQDAAREAADRFAFHAVRSVAEKGTFDAAIPGGSSPRGLFARLGEGSLVHGIPWQHTRIFFTDERCVPPDHEDSNYNLAHHLMFSRVAIPESHIYRFQGELPPDEAARNYEETIRTVMGELPRFDLVVLGMGTDMHTASLFPLSPAVSELKRMAVPNFVKSRHEHRLTLTIPILCNAASIMVLAFGKAKAMAVAAALSEPADPERRPVQAIEPVNGRLLWIIDSAAASEL